MDYSSSPDAGIIDSWHKNALPWAHAVRARAIESRRLVTDQAIVDAVLSRSPRSVIDLGCGEGWLIRALAASGRDLHLMGYDLVPALIERATAAGGGEFQVASYEGIAAGQLRRSADVVVCNFSLLGQRSVEGVFAARAGSWEGFGGEFCDPAPWYFRTIGSWLQLFRQSGLRLQELREPMHPVTGQPASVIFVADVIR